VRLSPDQRSALLVAAVADALRGEFEAFCGTWGVRNYRSAIGASYNSPDSPASTRSATMSVTNRRNDVFCTNRL
jgi:hypothetical protein